MQNLHDHNPKDILLDVLRHKKSHHVPWVPFAGSHAGKLKNYSAIEIFKDESKLLECLLEVNKQYQPNGQPVFFDLQIEAEILGCGLKWHEKGPPSISNHPFENNDTIPNYIPKESDGRIPFVLNVMKKFKEKVGDSTALFGLFCGPLTLAAHLRGTKLFIDLLRNKDYALKLINYTSEIGKRMAEYYSNAGMDILAVVDPVVSQISPRVFKQYLLEPFSHIFKKIKESNKFSSFFVCGDATNNLDLMCQSGPDSIFVDENVDMANAKKILKPYKIILGGNIPLTTVLLYGTQQDNMKYVVDLMDNIGTEDLIIAPGCDMPYDIPIDNVIGVIQAIKEPILVRNAIKNYEKADMNINIELPDYKHLKKPLIEVFTLDSDICAACGYMRDAGLQAKDHFGETIDFREYKIITQENIARMKKMKIEHLPSLLINGELCYSSIIPNKEELIKKIEKMLK